MPFKIVIIAYFRLKSQKAHTGLYTVSKDFCWTNKICYKYINLTKKCDFENEIRS